METLDGFQGGTLISGPGNLEEQGESLECTLDSKAAVDIRNFPRHPLHQISNDPSSKNTATNSGWPQNGAGRIQRAFNSNGRQSSLENDVTSFPSDEKDDGLFVGNTQPRQDRQQPSTENRTLLLKGLPERATHRDVVSVIRGGALVDVFLRPRERQASVSFAEGRAAQEFLAFTKRQDLFILDKLIEVTWSDRQFFLAGLVATKLANGASRNLVIRSVHPNLTESRIRDDLEHIHNLVVIDTTFDKGNAYISTNSVHNALFARTCMMSRLAYKGMKIEYYPDECARPLPKVQYVPKKVVPSPPVKKATPMANRFQMLNMDGANDSDEEDELTSTTSLGGNLSWANSSIAV
ncbi:conserved hypothetical protein [Histoplasma capsulatum G186AR]|uniref:RRM domain-containing protein n=1 Tax=Ajellomyces capsulatus (strain G186AR / H82 / ATCC MYA-2454 / RMSCC 2432) TaxID=447093 RepID=C0NVE0_AJECG|nr:uncharacterized protein HCBG_07120 [Histoplasma capsulatum G186AR]EEH04479.1 conserved hypothetical protein [Histoplasma capsulatum G186AR]